MTAISRYVPYNSEKNYTGGVYTHLLWWLNYTGSPLCAEIEKWGWALHTPPVIFLFLKPFILGHGYDGGQLSKSHYNSKTSKSEKQYLQKLSSRLQSRAGEFFFEKTFEKID